MDRDEQRLTALFDELRRDDARAIPPFAVKERSDKAGAWQLGIRYAVMVTVVAGILALAVVAVQSPSAPFAHLAWGLASSDLDQVERRLP